MRCWYCDEDIDLDDAIVRMEVKPTSGAMERIEAFHDKCADRMVEECDATPPDQEGT